MNLKDFLLTVPAFRTFHDRDLDALAKAMRVEDHAPGQVLIEQGVRGKDVFLLIEGEVAVRRFDALTRQYENLKTLTSGELFGLLSLTDGTPAAASCTAISAVKVGSLPRTAFRLLTESAAPIAYHFQLLIAQQLARDLHGRTQALRQMLLTA